MTTAAAAAKAPARSAAGWERDPADWVDDMRWHRRMYRESRFRWVAEDAMSLALAWTRGRVEFTTPGHLRRLDLQLLDLSTYAAGIRHAMLDPLDEARARCTAADYDAGLHLIGMTRRDVDVLRHASLAGTGRVHGHPEALRAMRGIPLPNPYSQVWELRQMDAMYAAAGDILEDALCDLAVELAPRQGWGNLAPLTVSHRMPGSLQRRVEQQRQEHGEPGDPRRRRAQRYH